MALELDNHTKVDVPLNKEPKPNPNWSYYCFFFVCKEAILLWTPTYGQTKAGRPARTYIQQLCEDTGCSPEDLLEAMNDREEWRERVRDIRASGTT